VHLLLHALHLLQQSSWQQQADSTTFPTPNEAANTLHVLLQGKQRQAEELQLEGTASCFLVCSSSCSGAL
jgi:hypothetical protein